jgi:hypothetical protein
MQARTRTLESPSGQRDKQSWGVAFMGNGFNGEWLCAALAQSALCDEQRRQNEVNYP